jgi:hypothetical protein
VIASARSTAEYSIIRSTKSESLRVRPSEFVDSGRAAIAPLISGMIALAGKALTL